MCCFTGPVERVSDTSIFARLEGGRQVIVYSMSVDLPRETAMVLPIPVAMGAGEKAVDFVSLEGYPEFFSDMRTLFPVAAALSEIPQAGVARSCEVLEVHSVGSYEASYVPSPRDFERLDPRFRLPAELWSKLPLYTDYGFAVFKLKAGSGVVHPMAFTFPTRHPETLFFPTVHIHDGSVHEHARFDHTLYAQKAVPMDWEPSGDTAEKGMRVHAAQGLISGSLPVYRRALAGTYRNRDVTLPGWEP